MKYRFLFVAYALFLFAGCDKEEDIKVKEGLEVSYALPQGDHDYDDDIVAWYDKYGFYTLYIYENKDIYWSNTEWAERFEEYGKAGGGSLKAKMAEEDHVGKQLELFKASFIDLYPDSLLTRYMPLKVLCCSELFSANWAMGYDWEIGQMVRKLVYDKLWAYNGWDYIAINGGSQEINTLDNVSKMYFSAGVNAIFMKRLYEADKIKMTEEFANVSDYTYEYLTAGATFARGFIVNRPLGHGSLISDQEADFGSYMDLASMPLELLETVPDTRYDDDMDYENGGIYKKMSLVGALHETRDVNGLVRKKYEAVIKILKEVGIDTDKLQKGY